MEGTDLVSHADSEPVHESPPVSLAGRIKWTKEHDLDGEILLTDTALMAAAVHEVLVVTLNGFRVEVMDLGFETTTRTCCTIVKVDVALLPDSDSFGANLLARLE
jgi:hypothetical protein